jgi:hypothetical protein
VTLAGAIGLGAVSGWCGGVWLAPASTDLRRAAVVASAAAVAAEAALIGGTLVGVAALVGMVGGAVLGRMWLQHLRSRAGAA